MLLIMSFIIYVNTRSYYVSNSNNLVEMVKQMKDTKINIYYIYTYSIFKDFAKQRYNTPYACNVI